MSDRELKMKLALDDRFTKKIGKAKKAQAGFAKSAKGEWADVSKYIATAGTTLAMYFGARAMLDFGKNILATAVEVDNLAKSYRVSRQELQELKYAADITGVAFESFIKGQKRLAANARDAKNGLAEAVLTFQELGVSVVDAEGELRPLNELFSDTMSALGRVENTTQRTALALKAMGRAGDSLLPVVEDNAAAFKELTDRAKDMGRIMSDEDIAAARALDDALTDLQSTISGIGREIMTEYIPALVEATEMMTSFLGEYAKNRKRYAGMWVGGLGAFSKTVADRALAQIGVHTPSSRSRPGEELPAGELPTVDDLGFGGAEGGGDPFAGFPTAPFEESEAAEKQRALRQKLREEAEIFWDQQAFAEEAREEQKLRVREEYAQRAIDSMRFFGMTEVEELYARQAEELERLEGFEEAKAETMLRYGAKIHVIKKKQRERDLRDQQDKDRRFLEGAKNFLASHFSESKSAAIALAIINAHQGASQALRAYPPPKSWAMAAISLAKGFKEVKSIKKTSIGSGGGDSGGLGGGGGAGGSTGTPAQPVPIPLDGRDLRPSMVFNIISHDADHTADIVEEKIANNISDGRGPLAEIKFTRRAA